MNLEDLFLKPDPILSSLEDCTELGSVESFLSEEGLTNLIGVDEVGRGALAGPVTVCAAFLGPVSGTEDWLSGVNDSKKLTATRRAKVVEALPDSALVEVATSPASRIDEIGIRAATREAMDTAVTRLAERIGCEVQYVLVDGGTDPLTVDFPQTSLTRGDSRSYNISVASIYAKEHRDRTMREMGEAYPEYGFEQHSGYGTKKHCAAIEEFGPCAEHRKTFGRVREYVSD